MEELRLLAGSSRVFTAASAATAGYGPAALKRLARLEAVTSLGRGWYAVGVPRTEHEEHLLRTAAAEARYGGRAVPSHYSEMLRLGLPLFRADLTTVHLTLVGAGHPRRRSNVVVHPRPRLPLSPSGRIPPALAVVQTGVVCGAVAALVAADAALGRGLVSARDLSDALRAVRGSPGTSALASVLSRADGRAQSPGETRLRHALWLLGCPATPQARISAGTRVAYVDLLLDESPVVVEFDGLVKYGENGLRPGREELVAEKQREDWLRELGYAVVRVTWADLDDLPALASRVEAAIRRAGAPNAGHPWRP